jgi:disulfide bond formation protein DsbB
MQFMNMVIDIADRLDTSRLAMAEAGLGVMVLGFVYASQYLGGLQPCVLCLYQRWPWWVATGLAILALVLRRHLRMQAVAVGLASFSILLGACIAAFHVGVEQHLWQGLASCISVSDLPLTVEALKAQIMNAPVARCDEVTGSFLGISMSGYNAMISGFVGIAGLGLAWRNRAIGP